jgi:hypothetical protein
MLYLQKGGGGFGSLRSATPVVRYHRFPLHPHGLRHTRLTFAGGLPQTWQQLRRMYPLFVIRLRTS